MSSLAIKKFKSIKDFPALVEYLGDELDWPIVADDFEENFLAFQKDSTPFQAYRRSP